MAQCKTPYQPKGQNIAFPCGGCLDCRKRRAAGWGFRLRQQLKVSNTAYFLTLTYDNEHVPITPNGFLTLYPAHVKNYIKTLRKTQERALIKMAEQTETKYVPTLVKYYQVGEYGGIYNRPHYHLIIYNLELETLITSKWKTIALNNPDYYLKGKYHYQTKYWKHGTITIGQVEEASIMYCLKYIQKGKTVPIHGLDDRQPEYQCMSKGLGLNYITDEALKWHYGDHLNRYYGNNPGGIKVPLPRYLKERIYDADMRIAVAENMHQKERQRLMKLTEDQLRKELQLNDKLRIKNHKERVKFVRSKKGNVL